MARSIQCEDLTPGFIFFKINHLVFCMILVLSMLLVPLESVAKSQLDSTSMRTVSGIEGISLEEGVSSEKSTEENLQELGENLLNAVSNEDIFDEAFSERLEKQAESAVDLNLLFGGFSVESFKADISIDSVNFSADNNLAEVEGNSFKTSIRVNLRTGLFESDSRNIGTAEIGAFKSNDFNVKIRGR